MSLKNKTAIITGASRGIGLAIAKALAQDGVRLALLSRTKPPASIRGKFIACDFANPEEIPPAVTRALKHLGDVDFLINNAGVFLEKSVPDTPIADWERILRVNLTAPFLICRAVLPLMIARKQGKIVNIASTASVQGYLHQAAYCASKHGLLGFARSLAVDAKPHHVHVCSICPGGVDTGLIKGTHLGERLKGQAMIAPPDIANMVVFLLKQPGNIDIPELIIRRFST